MSTPLTIVTRQMLFLLKQNGVHLEFGGIPKPDEKTEQSHIDLEWRPADFDAAIEEWSERILMPMAEALARDVKSKNATRSFELPLNVDGMVMAARHNFDGTVLRAVVRLPIDPGALLPVKVVPILTFDMLYA